MDRFLRILIVEDSEDDAYLLVRHLKRGGYTVEHERVETSEAMQQALSARSWDVILSDHSMPLFSALGALEVLKASRLDIPFLVVSGTIGEETAVSMLKAGANDFLLKDNLTRLLPAIERELREAENRRAQREVETRFELLVDRLPGIVYLSRAGHSAQITYVSPQIQQILGYTPEEWLANPTFWETRLHEEDRERVLKLAEQSDQTGDPVVVEYRMLAKDGRTIWFQDQVALVRDDRGQPLYWQGLMIDITERKAFEEQILKLNAELEGRVQERTREVERALRAKDEFLASMSHELRTPLNSILGLSESLSEHLAGPLNEKQDRYVNTIIESGRHLLSLINDILDLAKIEAGQIVLNIDEVDVARVCQASVRMINTMALRKNQQVSLDIEEHIGPIWADERRLKQVLVNLLSNAVKFTPEHGTLGLLVRARPAEKQILFTVWDRGIGISQEDLARIFQPFVQLDSKLTREVTGTGLGLALVTQMVRLHGGGVSVESQPGVGSSFTVTLPWETALATDTEIRLKSTGKFRAIRPNAMDRPLILVVEASQESSALLVDHLERAGYWVLTARDGVSGIHEAGRTHPSLILIDVQLPGMDGLETIRRLRADPNFRQVPIIALSALALAGDRERCIAVGATDYLAKPVNPQQLNQMTERYLLR